MQRMQEHCNLQHYRAIDSKLLELQVAAARGHVSIMFCRCVENQVATTATMIMRLQSL